MKERIITNAEIKSTMLGTEDHGIFTFFLSLDFGGSGQGFGGWTLDEPRKQNGKFVGRFGTAQGLQKIMDLLVCLEVARWEELKGQFVRVEREEFGEIYKIGHLIEDRWFALREK